MVAELRLNPIMGTPEGSSKGQKLGAKARRSKLIEMVELQDDMKALAQDADLKPLERSSAARVWKELEMLRRCALGLASPAPVKQEPKGRPGRRTERLAALDPEPASEPIATVPPTQPTSTDAPLSPTDMIRIPGRPSSRPFTTIPLATACLPSSVR